MRLLSSSLFFLGLVFSTESHSNPKFIAGCGSKMTCKDEIQKFSPLPLKLSLAPGPLPCIQLTNGTISKEIATRCEKFVVSADGSARQRAIALTNLGYYYQFGPNGLIVSAAVWDKAAAVDPSYVEPLVAKAAALVLNDDYLAALPVLDLAEKRDDRHWRIWAIRSEVFLKTGNLVDALKNANNSVNVAPENPAAHFALATILEETGDLKNAAVHFVESGKNYDPAAPAEFPGVAQKGNPWLSAASVEVQQKDYSSALIAINNGIEGNKGYYGDPNLRAKRAQILELMGRYSEAASEYDEASIIYSSPQIGMPDWSEKYKMKAAEMSAKAGIENDASRAFDDIFITGDLKKILKVQLFLRNNGFNDVIINGKNSADLKSAISACVARSHCFATMRQAL